jgi:sialate O-acetylesterase
MPVTKPVFILTALIIFKQITNMKYIFFLLVVMCGGISNAQLRLPSVLSSGMVLQQKDSVTIWGWGYTGLNATVNTSWDNKNYTDKINNLGKWKVRIKTPVAGGPYAITINSGGQQIALTDVLIGEVWLCSGQSNMEWSFYNGARFIKEEFATCYNNNLRFYHVPRFAAQYPQEDIKTNWQVCDSNSIKAFSAVAYFFGKRLQQQLNVPIGLINASWGGTPAETWANANSVYSDATLKAAAEKMQEVPWGPVAPGYLYNGMLYPVTSFSIAGAIWYQGESNVGAYNTYTKLLTTMVESWRSAWKKEFPFYYVQIAPYNYGSDNINGALLMEAQTKAQQYKKMGMVVITDQVDTVADIHPKDKRQVGARLANWALADNYGKDTIVYKSPALGSFAINKNKIELSIINAPTGLANKGNAVIGFYIAGADKNWQPATAIINKSKIVVSTKTVKEPLYVRYGFTNTLIGSVFSNEGLPLCPFRTDND